MSDHRQEILSRVREALQQPTDPHVRGAAASRVDVRPEEWLPLGGLTTEERLGRFAEWSEKLKTNFLRVPSEAAAAAELARIAHEEGWRRVALHGDPLVEAATASLSTQRLNTDGGYDAAELETCDAGVTACDALIAQTGSVLLTSRSAGGRALSVLPPHHVTVARLGQLLPDLPSAYALLREKYGADWPSFMTLISGPSRTGDIERILVLGAHGPKRLTVLLVED